MKQLTYIAASTSKSLKSIKALSKSDKEPVLVHAIITFSNFDDILETSIVQIVVQIDVEKWKKN